MRRKKTLGIALSVLLLVNLFVGLGVLPTLAEQTGDGYGTTYAPVTDPAQLPDSSLLSGRIPTKTDGSAVNIGNGTKLSNLTDGGVQGLNQTVAYRLTENAMSKNGAGSYYNWIAPTELVELLGYDTAKTWYIQDNNDRWWGSNVNDTAGTLYKDNAKLVYDLGTRSTVEQIFIASSTEIGDGPTNSNTAGPNQACSWAAVQQQMAVTHADRYALVCHVYIGDTRNVFDEGQEIMSFDWQAKADNAKALRNLFTLSETAEGQYIGFDFTDDDAVSGFIRLSELAVYGSQALHVTDIDADNVDTVAIMPEENLLKNATMGGSGTVVDSTGSLYDGIISLLNTTEQASNLWCPSAGSYRSLWLQWDLGQAYAVDSFMLCGSGNTGWGAEGGCGVYGMDVYVGDKTAAELKAETDDVTQPDYTTTAAVIKGLRVDFATAPTGRYLVVRVGGYPRTGGNEGQVWISEVGAIGSPVDATTVGQWETITVSSTIWQRENRLAGRTPLYIDGSAVHVTDGQYLTDGRLNAEPERTLVSGFYNGWAPLTFDLGAAYALDQFLVAGDYESAGYAPHRVRIYVSDTCSTLYTSEHLAVDSGAMERTAKQWQLRPVGGTVTGRYVGFFIYMPDYDVSTELCFDDAGNKLYANWWGGIRLGELGAYGTPTGDPAEEPKPIKTVVCVGDSLTAGVWNDGGQLCGDKRSYPQQLAELLNTADAPCFYAVTNAGYGGRTMVSNSEIGKAESTNGVMWGWMKYHSDNIVAADYVMIALGGNDAADWEPRRALYRENYRALVAAFREKNPAVQVFVLTPQYMTTSHHIALEAEILKLQRDIAEELGAVYVDNYTPTKRYYQQHGSSYFGDPSRGLHPGEEGLGVVARNVYRAMTSATRGLGVQRRLDNTAENTAALRFGMAVDCTGVTVGDGYAALYAEDSTVTVAAVPYRLVGMGGVAALADALTDAEAQLVQGGSGVRTVPAAKLYAAGDGRAYFTVAVVNIPASAYDRVVAVRPYAVYAAADGTETVVYGNIQYGAVNDFPLE